MQKQDTIRTDLSKEGIIFLHVLLCRNLLSFLLFDIKHRRKLSIKVKKCIPFCLKKIKRNWPNSFLPRKKQDKNCTLKQAINFYLVSVSKEDKEQEISVIQKEMSIIQHDFLVPTGPARSVSGTERSESTGSARAACWLTTS